MAQKQLHQQQQSSQGISFPSCIVSGSRFACASSRAVAAMDVIHMTANVAGKRPARIGCTVGMAEGVGNPTGSPCLASDAPEEFELE